MKKYILFIGCVAFISCNTYEEIGKVNMISNRNIDSKMDYEMISSYTGSNKSDILRSRASTLEEAIDQSVRKVPGGEFLMNVKLYKISNGKWAVEGDVWGPKREIKEVSVRGFKVGDTVVWKRMGKFISGKISALKNNEKVLVQTDSDSKIIELAYSELTKIEK